jgi:hypothetical protein
LPAEITVDASDFGLFTLILDKTLAASHESILD